VTSTDSYRDVWSSASFIEGDATSVCFDDPFLRYISHEQAKEWLRFESFENIHTLSEELEIISQNFMETLPLNSKINLVDLGCGSGTKSTQFIQLLLKHNVDISGYYAVDVNQIFIDTTQRRVCRIGGLSVAKFHGYCTKFETLAEQRPFPWKFHDIHSGSLVIQLFLGNTFNNFAPKRILKLLRILVQSHERILIGVKVRSHATTEEIEQAVNEYKSFGDDFSFSFGHVLGLDNDEMTRDVRYNPVSNCVEIWIRSTRELTPPGFPAVKARNFLIFRSYRPTFQEVLAELQTVFRTNFWQSKKTNDVIFYCGK